MRRRVVATALLVCVLVLVSANGAWGKVKDWYEWKTCPLTGKPARNLQIWSGPETSPQWQGWLDEAIANWNNANTGWTLSVTDDIDDADITFHQAPIPPNERGEVLGGWCEPVWGWEDTNLVVIGATITMNTDVKWGTSGDDVWDPVKAIKHELGHAMRLADTGRGNLMNKYIPKGDHNCAPNDDDVDEAKKAATSTVEKAEVAPEGEHGMRVGAGEDAALRLTDQDYFSIPEYWGRDLSLLPLSGVMLPDPEALHQGLERVVAAAGVFPLESEFVTPAELTLSVSQGAVSGLELVGELHWDSLPPVDMARMTPVMWTDETVCPICGGHCWQPVPVPATYDPATGTVTMTVFGGGVYGVAAPLLEQDEVSEARAFTDVGPAADPLVAASLTELNAMDIYRGYPDHSAGPERSLTRLELITLAVRIAGGEDEALGLASQRPAFVDDIPDWGWGYINQAVVLGLTRGYPDGTFRPNQNVTGDEAVAILVRLLGGQEEWIAQQQPWPAGYIAVADDLGLFEDLAEVVADLEPWRAAAITRGEMAVITRSAMWTELRHQPGGAIIEGPSLVAAGGWWRATVTVASATADGRRWLIERPVVIAEGQPDVIRLDVDATLYVVPGGWVPAPGPQDTATVIGRGFVVRAVTGGGGGT